MTFYYWNFGNQLIPGIQGFAQANSYSHTYNTPNDYNVVVIAKNNGGNNTAQLLVHVLGNLWVCSNMWLAPPTIDQITGFNVFYSHTALPGFLINFYANITSTKYNTNVSYISTVYSSPTHTHTHTIYLSPSLSLQYYEPVRYTWIFSNIQYTTTVPVVTHTFISNGTQSFSVIVSNVAGSKPFSGQVLVEDSK